jgi:3-hydroxyacyl-CoA dehydrogenase-like protein
MPPWGAQCPTPQPRPRWSALAAGLADAVHPAEELLDAALALAGRIAERPWRALKLTKLALRAHRPATTAFDVAAQALLFEGEDKRERMRAFLGRTRPAAGGTGPTVTGAQAGGPGLVGGVAVVGGGTMGAGITRVLLAAGPPVTLVEVVRGRATSPEALAAAHRLAGLAGKEAIEVADSPGFATSRLGVAIGLEAIRMVQEGVGTPEDIDKAMVLGYRYPMGPLRLSDLVGLDVRLSVAEYLHARLGDHLTHPSCCDAWSPRAGWGRRPGAASTTGTDGSTPARAFSQP